MPQLVDCYILGSSRRTSFCYNVLNHFVPLRKESSSEYVIPQYSDDRGKSFYDLHNLLTYLEKNTTEEYSIYFENIDNRSLIRNLMLFFTDDGMIIIGVSLLGKLPNEPKIIEIFNNIKKILNSKMGCITSEEPPPNNSTEFVTFCNNRYKPLNSPG